MLKTTRNLLRKEKGVTLVELLAVIIILGIIALIAVPAIAGVIDESKYNSLKASAINAIEAAELYRVTNDDLPEGISELEGYYDSKGVTWSTGPTFTEGSNGTILLSGTVTVDSKEIKLTNASVSDIDTADISDDDSTID
ncbi:prepilin-type N-terminal cleavage/methylation domain-containing protein [Piscibacillus salipiscarius]|uniref:Prepilin-type N-terminal cleavage/methylation domain-containing protein n=1 Tax=Piscibacillus salipiscarius TaxID=299480 RepID=A0ABW5QC39_9BACI|nr:prepilin-type N-terminal cleavage/methylation domain-containing protein [Piscibacillus salipiscarius]